MRPVLKKLGKLTLQLFSVFLIIVACGKDDGPEVNDPTPRTNPDNPDGVVQDSVEKDSVPILDVNLADPNLVTQSLILDNMKIIEGELPKGGSSTAKLMPEDLQIDSDTIFWTPGVVKRIKIRSPQQVLITGAWFYVSGSDSYIEASVREEESTDEISILYFQFDPSGWELPVSFDLKLVPLGKDGDPIALPDAIPPIVTELEKPHDNSTGSCDWKKNTFWRWQYYENKTFTDPIVPAFAPRYTPGSTAGCCNGDAPCDQIGGTPCLQSLILDYANFSYVGSVWFFLHEDGRFNTWENTRYSNLDICSSDFCTNTAAYSQTNKIGKSNGDFFIRNDCSLELNPLEFEFEEFDSPMIGGGPYVQFKMISDHFLEEIVVGSPDGGGVSDFKEVYERVTARDIFFGEGPSDDQEELLWYDLVNPTSSN